MQQRQLGSGGLTVGGIGLGCMSFGGIYGPTNTAESHRTLSRARDLGIDFLDVADVYGDGRSEEVIGMFLKAHGGGFRIATKGGIKTRPTRSFDNSEAYLRACLEGSLRRLGVDYVDLYYVHRRDQTRPIEDVVETLVRFKEEGKIGAIGFSEIAPASLNRASAVHPIMAVQNEYSLWTRLPELGIIQACRRLGTAFVAFSPLGRGVFSRHGVDPATFADTDFRKTNPRFREPNFSYNARAIAHFADYAREKGHSPAALALAWVLHRGDHIIPIPGTRFANHLSECADGAVIKLSAQDLIDIEAILPVGFAHGDRYSDAQAVGPERYC